MVICQCAILNYQRVNKIIIPFIFHWLFHIISWYIYHSSINIPLLPHCHDIFQNCSPGRRSRPRPCAPPCAPPWRACQRLSVPRCATWQFNQEHLGLTSWKKNKNKWLLFDLDQHEAPTKSLDNFNRDPFLNPFLNWPIKQVKELLRASLTWSCLKGKGFSLPLPANLQNKNGLLAIGGRPTLQ